MNRSKKKITFRVLLRRFIHQERGVALIEFAITFPVMFLLLFGGIEVVRLMLIQQKLEKTGYVIADIVTQYLPATADLLAGEISESEMTTNVFPQFNRTMSPYSVPIGTLSPDQAIIVTSVQRNGGSKLIKWQIAGGGTLSGCDTGAPPHCVTSIVNGLAPSAIGSSVLNTTTSFPPEQENILINMTDQSNLIVVEVFYYYRPILKNLLIGVGNASTGAGGFRFFIDDRIYIKRTFFSPRNGVMLYLPPNFPAPLPTP